MCISYTEANWASSQSLLHRVLMFWSADMMTTSKLHQVSIIDRYDSTWFDICQALSSWNLKKIEKEWMALYQN